MRYLKLDARHPECHGLARALVGSPCKNFDGVYSGYDFELVGIAKGKRFLIDSRFAIETDSIYLPIMSIKLCPYVAMREGVRVKGVLRECEWDGTLDECNHGLFTFDTNFEISEITLDLDNLPKGTEIVEDVK